MMFAQFGVAERLQYQQVVTISKTKLTLWKYLVDVRIVYYTKKGVR